jgi:hypothetical protein
MWWVVACVVGCQRPSTWVPLTDAELPAYFTPYEIDGLTGGGCDDPPPVVSHDPLVATWDQSHNMCCPSAPVRNVEVACGKRTPPFQARLMAERNTTIWLSGDSITALNFVGMVCAFLRAGATMTLCELTAMSRDRHPLCRTALCNKPVCGNTTVARWHPKILSQSFNHVKAAAHFVLQGVEIKLHEVCDPLKTNRCRRAMARARPPHVFLPNAGLHLHNARMINTTLSHLLRLRLPVVWFETTVQHFPLSHGMGVWEAHMRHKAPAWVQTLAPGSRVCAPITNMTRNRHNISWIWRQELTAAWLKAYTPHIPILETHFLEAALFDTYANTTKIDCSHHIYAPLYYDAVFMRLARLL